MSAGVEGSVAGAHLRDMWNAASIDRRLLLAGLSAAGLAACSKAEAVERDLLVYKTETCGCCKGWITHMTRAGFIPRVEIVEDVSKLTSAKGVRFELSSCHMAEIGGYVVVGHVPPADVERLLAEKPKAIGLTVPGMPMGSPGMESPTGETEPYETLLVESDGSTRVFARHA